MRNKSIGLIIVILLALFLFITGISCASQQTLISPTDEATKWLREGDKYTEQQQWEKAVAAYTNSIELDSNNIYAFINRSWAYRQLGKYDNALTDSNSAVDLDPENAKAYESRSYTYKKLERYEEALADASKAIQLDPKLASAYDCRASIYSTIR